MSERDAIGEPCMHAGLFYTMCMQVSETLYGSCEGKHKEEAGQGKSGERQSWLGH